MKSALKASNKANFLQAQQIQLKNNPIKILNEFVHKERSKPKPAYVTLETFTQKLNSVEDRQEESDLLLLYNLPGVRNQDESRSSRTESMRRTHSNTSPRHTPHASTMFASDRPLSTT